MKVPAGGDAAVAVGPWSVLAGAAADRIAAEENIRFAHDPTPAACAVLRHTQGAVPRVVRVRGSIRCAPHPEPIPFEVDTARGGILSAGEAYVPYPGGGELLATLYATDGGDALVLVVTPYTGPSGTRLTPRSVTVDGIQSA